MRPAASLANNSSPDANSIVAKHATNTTSREGRNCPQGHVNGEVTLS